MNSKFMNGCQKQETLEIMELFQSNPHCHTFSMTKCEDCDQEYVHIGFTHYSDDFYVDFNSETKVGELFVNYRVSDKWESHYYGIITVDKLDVLLKKLPHISDFMEDEDTTGVCIH